MYTLSLFLSYPTFFVLFFLFIFVNIIINLLQLGHFFANRSFYLLTEARQSWVQSVRTEELSGHTIHVPNFYFDMPFRFQIRWQYLTEIPGFLIHRVANVSHRDVKELVPYWSQRAFHHIRLLHDSIIPNTNKRIRCSKVEICYGQAFGTHNFYYQVLRVRIQVVHHDRCSRLYWCWYARILVNNVWSQQLGSCLHTNATANATLMKSGYVISQELHIASRNWKIACSAQADHSFPLHSTIRKNRHFKRCTT
mmetsp:Transcript_21205/g.34165  ORF Transcript_21205/g.34165 Transcript_21205/m.34165 type:complete len:252 (-) Transcript_21205:582-1337(-)